MDRVVTWWRNRSDKQKVFLILLAVFIIGGSLSEMDSVAPTTTEAPACHPSYEGACVPVDVSDVDCAGGSGNGPYYVGRVRVVGPDVYGLDRDHDGIGCESS